MEMVMGIVGRRLMMVMMKVVVGAGWRAKTKGGVVLLMTLVLALVLVLVLMVRAP
jgi:hypothetical protein